MLCLKTVCQYWLLIIYLNTACPINLFTYQKFIKILKIVALECNLYHNICQSVRLCVAKGKNSLNFPLTIFGHKKLQPFTESYCANHSDTKICFIFMSFWNENQFTRLFELFFFLLPIKISLWQDLCCKPHSNTTVC